MACCVKTAWNFYTFLSHEVIFTQTKKSYTIISIRDERGIQEWEGCYVTFPSMTSDIFTITNQN